MQLIELIVGDKPEGGRLKLRLLRSILRSFKESSFSDASSASCSSRWRSSNEIGTGL